MQPQLAVDAPEPSLRRSPFVELLLRERAFLVLLSLGFLVVGGTYDQPGIARWVGFSLAAYAAVGNDSIQTIGTFIASNAQRAWWVMWLFIGGIYVGTVAWSWWSYGGDVSYGRLASKGFETAPASFGFLQVAAPLFLLVLTRLRMPVSTTFLLLTSFTTSAGSVGGVLTKSLSGYVVAFGVAMAVWVALGPLMHRLFKGEAHPGWRVAQWISSGALWSVWIQQDAANIAVYLPRSLSGGEFLASTLIVFLGLGLLFYSRGERVQEIVNAKSHVIDVRPATVIDLVYAALLYYFKALSDIPMSTTWVFLGLLGGRELAMSLRGVSGRGARVALGLMTADIVYAFIGLSVSVVLAAAVNQGFQAELLGLLGLGG